LEIFNRRIGELKPYANNPRNNDEAVEAVAASIREFGFKVPIITDRDGVIIAGHTRLKAAERLGLEEVPVIMADDLTEDQVKAFRLADNKVSELATWDADKLAIELDEIDIDMAAFGFEDFEFEDIEIDEIQETETPEVPSEPTTVRGDVYRLGRHYLMCGDSTDAADVRRLMRGTKADMLLTDPPYNCDYAGKNASLNKADKGNRIQDDITNDNMDDADFTAFLTDAFTNADASIKDGAPFYIWHVDHKAPQFLAAVQAMPWKWHQTLIWVKNNMVLGHCDYQKKHEPCLYGWKEGAAHYFQDDRTQKTVIEDKADLKHLSKDELRRMVEDLLENGASTTVIHEDKPQISDLHPTMKPIKLFARLIRNSTEKGGTVLDLFGGSGSSMIACEQLGRTCYMMELEPRYVDTIIERWERFTGGKAVKVNDRKTN
jgi:site-specific DNA-methyltransferase (adenine-specific)